MTYQPLPLFADDHPSDEGFDHDLRQSLRHTFDPVARLALRVLEQGGSRDRWTNAAWRHEADSRPWDAIESRLLC